MKEFGAIWKNQKIFSLGVIAQYTKYEDNELNKNIHVIRAEEYTLG